MRSPSTSARPARGRPPSTSTAAGSSRSAAPTRPRSPRPGWAEQDARLAVGARSGARATSSRRARRPARRVRAIGLTGQCPSVVLVDRAGRAGRPGPHLPRQPGDGRGGRRIRERFGDAGDPRRTGHLPSAFHIAPKLLWLRAPRAGGVRRDGARPPAPRPRRPGADRRGGDRRARTPRRRSSTTCGRGRWDGGLLDDLGPAEPASSRRIGRPDEVVGDAAAGRRARGSACRPATPVVLGGADSQACALGAGVVGARPGQRDGRLVDVSQRRRPGAARRARGHPLPARRARACTRPRPASTRPARPSAGSPTSLYGGRRGPAAAGRLRAPRRRGRGRARGRGRRAGRPGPRATASGPTRTCAARSPASRCVTTGRSSPGPCLEGVAYAIARPARAPPRAAARPWTSCASPAATPASATWNRIKADVTGLPVRTIPGDAAVTGVAMLAGIGAGLYRDRGRRDRALRPPRSADRAATRRACAGVRRLDAATRAHRAASVRRRRSSDHEEA